ncbi:ectomycorrhizas secreted protein, partial [Suillus discolor]
LSAQTTRALLCVGLWSQLGLVKDRDIHSTASLPDIEAEEELQDGWDSIVLG